MTSTTLFDPGTLLGLDTPNRVVMGPLTRCRSNIFDSPFEIHEVYYAQRASAGLIISEATHISQQGKGFAGAPGIYSDVQLAGWSGVTAAVHRAGGRIISQLWHVGRISHPSLQPGGALPVAPSAIGFEGNAHTYFGVQPLVTPRALELGEIQSVVKDYGRAAQNAKSAGFDGIEIHAANGYLIDQFLRDGTNRRTDRYGGAKENRARFLFEVVEAAASVWTESKIGIRLSPSFSLQGMKDSNPEELFTFVAESLSKLGVGYIHVVEPVDPRGDPNSRLFDPKVLRDAFAGPYLANGGYNKSRAEQALRTDAADFVVFSRPFIANPDLPRRLSVGAPLADPDPATFYGGGLRGYSDYPVWSSAG